jgi:riboflavin kinase/FMN adenylyltransferase
MAAVSLDDKVISSTRIREEIRTGDFDRAGQMLGRAYSLVGQVMKGDRLGHQFGFPTANLDVAGLVLPPKGVYMAHAIVRGETRRAVVNIGVRPTLPDSEPSMRVEVHLLDFDADLYGTELEITFSERLRDEKKFASVEELRKQIARDITEAKKRF